MLLKRRLLYSSIGHHFIRAIEISLLLIFIVVFSAVIRGNYLTLSPLTKCQNSEEEIGLLVEITYKVHAILDSMGIECRLMYDSIWGPLRGIEGPLPWDNDVNLAIDGDGQFGQMTFEEFKALFIVLGLSVENRLEVRDSRTHCQIGQILLVVNYRNNFLRILKNHDRNWPEVSILGADQRIAASGNENVRTTEYCIRYS